MDLVILAIGIVLGVLCCAVWAKVKALEGKANGAADRASSAMLWTDQQLKLLKGFGDKQQEHDHEIAALFDKAGMRRP